MTHTQIALKHMHIIHGVHILFEDPTDANVTIGYAIDYDDQPTDITYTEYEYRSSMVGKFLYF